MPAGSAKARFRNSSSTPSRDTWPRAEYATSAAHGQTRPKSRSQAPISSRRTVRTRLARRLRRLSGDCAQHNPEPAHFLRSEHTTDAATPITRAARKSVVAGKRVSVRVDLGGRRIIKQKKTE